MKNLILAASAIAILALPACQTAPSNNVLVGAAGGAILGAGAGMMAGGDDKRNAAIGAAVGAVAGGAAGVYMDKQEKKLREMTAGTGIEVARVGDQIALTMPSNITFAVNKADIQPGFQASLNDVAATLIEYPSTAVDIIGHASSDGADDYNMALSQRRADSVKNYLVAAGMKPVRVLAVGRGETQPIADNSTEAGRAANRRVEIILTPIVDDAQQPTG